jgi:hypothetical protein
MEPVCRPMASSWQAPFASSRGYGSLTLQHDMAEMLNDRYARYRQPALIYFVSDLDPSGLDLQRSWREALASFGVELFIGADLDDDGFKRLGLTRAQVRDNRAESGVTLESLAIGVKASDSRSRAYIAQSGDQCWEVDILPSDIIAAGLNTDIALRLDSDLWNRREREIERARGLL